MLSVTGFKHPKKTSSPIQKQMGGEALSTQITLLNPRVHGYDFWRFTLPNINPPRVHGYDFLRV